MNAHDKSQLAFLLAVDAETLIDWYSKTSEDDHVYAMELMKVAADELIELALEQQTEAALAYQDDMAEARAALSKIMSL